MTSENLALNFAARSDRGLVRGNNEDSAVAASHLLALADGMGGHAAGEVASQLMIEALLPLNAMFHGDAPGSAPAITPDRLPGLLVEAMDAGNRAIAAHVDENPTLDGMGCTLSSLLFLDGRMGVCHVGDSRGYLLRDGVLTQITKDDTYVQSLVDEGKLDPADVSSHPQRSLILKALTGRPVEPTLQLLDTLPGDRFMLCSDGLSDPVSADTIREVLGEGTPDTAASRLIDLALRGGGPDNVTVVVADVVDMDATEGAGSVDLPTTAALAGAINSDETELPRPDTAAGRAMAVNVVNRSTPPADGDASDPAGTGESPTAPTDDMPPMRRPRRVGSRRTAGTHGDPAGADPTDPGRVDSPDPRQAKRRRRILVTVTVIVALVVIAGIGGWIAKRNLDDSYFVAVASSDDVPEPSTTATATTMPATTAAPEGTAPAAPSAPASAAAAA
uniref:protein phosphatase 2C domain-containing protein n=1 Tax=uncultured Corynebacterium sp. TaxID=159447 RepID=UPI0025FDA905